MEPCRGRINPGEPHKEGLAREIYEETKLKFDLNQNLKIIGVQDIFWSNRHTIRITYKGNIDGEVTLDKKENDKYAWLSEEEIIKIPEKERDKYFNEILKDLNGPDGIRTRDT